VYLCLYVGIVSRSSEDGNQYQPSGGEEGKRRKEEGDFEDIQQVVGRVVEYG